MPATNSPCEACLTNYRTLGYFKICPDCIERNRPALIKESEEAIASILFYIKEDGFTEETTDALTRSELAAARAELVRVTNHRGWIQAANAA